MSSGAGNKDILRSVNTSKLSAIALYEKTPFWPYVFRDVDNSIRVRFNPGYVIDYQNQTGDKIIGNVQKTFRPSNMDDSFTVNTANGKFFVLEIATSQTSAAISSVTIVQLKEAPALNNAWHFGSVNVNPYGYYLATSDKFRIPMCIIDETSGDIKEVCLRENIHYQQFHMENRPGGDARVLKTIGETPSKYGENPSTSFRSIKGVSPIVVEETPDVIYISYSTSTSGGSGSNGTGTPGTPTASGKSAIVPYKDKYISFWCAEAPEPYFFDRINTGAVKPRQEISLKVDDEFIESCEYVEVWSVFCGDSRIKFKNSYKNGLIKIKNLSWFRKADNFCILIGGLRKDFNGYRYKEQSEDILISNNMFYSLAHNPNFVPPIKQ